MGNASKLSAFYGKSIVTVNTDENPEEYASGILSMTGAELIGCVCGIIAEEFDVEEGDDAKMEELLGKVTIEDLMKIAEKYS